MMFNLTKFSDWPSPKKTKLLLFISLIIFSIIFPLMFWFFMQSGATINILVSQLSFSGAFLKTKYAIIIGAGGLNSYILAQSLDYGLMVSYGLLVFSLALILARKFEENSKWRNIGYTIALVGPIAVCMDICENAFILLTLSDPLGFPDWWAIAHSSFALSKWILLLFAIVWAIIAGIYYVIIKRKQ